MYYTIYKVTNKVDGKYYIGKHQTKKLDDGYMGSGHLVKRAIKKHGMDNFTKEILYTFQTEEEMNAMEKELVVLSEMSYNICEGGKGGFGYINANGLCNSKKGRKICSEILLEKYGVTNPGQLDCTRKASSERFKKMWEEGKCVPFDWTGRKHSNKTKKLIGNKNKGKPSWNKGIPRTKEEKENIRKGVLRHNADVTQLVE